MIQDPQGKGRPVYAVSASGSFVRLWALNACGDYEFEDDYNSLEELLADHPTAVKVVNKRQGPNKKRHPDVHYMPARRGAFCRIHFPDLATLTDEHCINAKRTTDVSKVTCSICLKAVAAAIVRTA